MAQEKLKENLFKLLKIFNGYPHIFILFLLKHNALTEDFKNKLTKSTIKDKPKRFQDIEKAMNFYSSLLIEETKPVDKEIDWNRKLLKALMEQRYEDAAKIRDIMITKGIEIKI